MLIRYFVRLTPQRLISPAVSGRSEISKGEEKNTKEAIKQIHAVTMVVFE